MESFDSVIDSPVGPLGLLLDQGKLHQIHLIDTNDSYRSLNRSNPWTKLIQHYFQNPFQTAWPYPKLDGGTDFQRKVWRVLFEIPCGEVRTYGQIAQALGSSPRAVGGACKRNPCPIVIPCHRVVAQKGLGGFFGQTHGEKYSIKAWLLKHEGLIFSQ